jgi:hypothetical protein
MPAEMAAVVELAVAAAAQLLSAEMALVPRVAQAALVTVQHYVALPALAAAAAVVRTQVAQAVLAVQAAEGSAHPLALELQLATDQLSQEVAAAADPVVAP